MNLCCFTICLENSLDPEVCNTYWLSLEWILQNMVRHFVTHKHMTAMLTYSSSTQFQVQVRIARFSFSLATQNR